MTENQPEVNQENVSESTNLKQIAKKRNLMDRSRESYSEENFEGHLLEQYKLYVEMMDRISARRVQTNSFYISLLSGLLAWLSLVVNKDISKFQDTTFQGLAILALAILGIILCFVWYINIHSYKQLNSGKFRVISEMEQHLPFPCYDKEWYMLQNDNKYQGYLTQTKVEKYIPFILAIPYVALLVYSVLSLIK